MRESGSWGEVFFGIKEAFRTLSLVDEKSVVSTPGYKAMKVFIIGFKDNEGETLFIPSAQAELLKNFYASIFRENEARPTPTLPVPTVVMPVPQFSIPVVHRELVLMTFTRRWYAV